MPKLFKEISDFREIENFKKNISSIKKEFIEFRKKATNIIDRNNTYTRPHQKSLEWIEELGHSSGYYEAGLNKENWTFIPIVKGSMLLFPRSFIGTYNLLKQVDNLYMAGFMILKQYKEVPFHKHQTKTVIFHLNLFTLNGRSDYYLADGKKDDPRLPVFAGYIEKRCVSAEGDVVVFNPFNYHETRNSSTTDRICFVVEKYV